MKRALTIRLVRCFKMAVKPSPIVVSADFVSYESFSSSLIISYCVAERIVLFLVLDEEVNIKPKLGDG